MPRYRVRFYEKVGYEVEVEAESVDAVYDMAADLPDYRNPVDAFDAEPLEEEDITMVEEVTST